MTGGLRSLLKSLVGVETDQPLFISDVMIMGRKREGPCKRCKRTHGKRCWKAYLERKACRKAEKLPPGTVAAIKASDDLVALRRQRDL